MRNVSVYDCVQVIRGALNGSLASGADPRTAGQLQVQVGSRGQLTTTTKLEPSLTVQTDEAAQPTDLSLELAPISTEVSLAQTPTTHVGHPRLQPIVRITWALPSTHLGL